MSEEQKITLSARGRKEERHSLCRDPARDGRGRLGLAQSSGAERVRAQMEVPQKSLGLLERCRGGREVFESLPAGSALLWECFPSAVTVPISVLQTLCPGGSGRCEVLSPGGVRADCCEILCTKNSLTSGQLEAGGPDLGLGSKLAHFLPGV